MPANSRPPLTGDEVIVMLSGGALLGGQLAELVGGEAWHLPGAILGLVLPAIVAWREHCRCQ